MLAEAREIYDRIRNVSDLIQHLGTVTLDSKDDIVAAEYAYKALPPKEKQSIQNYDVLVDARARYDFLARIDAVETAIDAVKNIKKIKNKDDLAPYTSAKKAYDALDDDEKSLIQNYNILTEFEENFPIGWTIPVLSEKEYWEFIDTQIRSIFRKYNLFIMRIDSRLPYCNYHIEPGILIDDNTYQPVGLGQEDYEALVAEVKDSLHELLNQYSIDYGEGFFSRPSQTIIGLHFYNRFNHSVFGHGAYLGVADYQVDLLDYYYHDSSAQYIVMDNFSDFYWTVSEVYTP